MFRLWVMKTAPTTVLLTLLLGWILFLSFSLFPTWISRFRLTVHLFYILWCKGILICNLADTWPFLTGELSESRLPALNPTLTAISATHLHPEFQWQFCPVFADHDCRQNRSVRLIRKDFVRTIRLSLLAFGSFDKNVPARELCSVSEPNAHQTLLKSRRICIISIS